MKKWPKEKKEMLRQVISAAGDESSQKSIAEGANVPYKQMNSFVNGTGTLGPEKLEQLEAYLRTNGYDMAPVAKLPSADQPQSIVDIIDHFTMLLDTLQNQRVSVRVRIGWVKKHLKEVVVPLVDEEFERQARSQAARSKQKG